MNRKIVVGMSGGVDSSVAALLLKQAGWDVIGVMLKLWAEEGSGRNNQCCSLESVSQARFIAAKIGIPFYLMDCVQDFYHQVVSGFIDDYIGGSTPNPCTNCNRLIRWNKLLHFAKGVGADYIATGHYARLKVDESGKAHLFRGHDLKKDQSYVLSRIPQEQLQHTIFPLHDKEKTEIRAIAAEYDLPSAQKPDSQDICFIADGDYRNFLRRQRPEAIHEGIIVDYDGKQCGRHDGLPFYTIGQRKGINVFRSDPVYVLEKSVIDNQLIVGKKEHLGKDIVYVSEVNLINRIPINDYLCQAQFRYKSQTWPVTLHTDENGDMVLFLEQELFDVAPGQIAVIYDGDEVLCSGRIMRTGKRL